jgi:hypothetical protein
MPRCAEAPTAPDPCTAPKVTGHGRTGNHKQFQRQTRIICHFRVNKTPLRGASAREGRPPIHQQVRRLQVTWSSDKERLGFWNFKCRQLRAFLKQLDAEDEERARLESCAGRPFPTTGCRRSMMPRITQAYTADHTAPHKATCSWQAADHRSAHAAAQQVNQHAALTAAQQVNQYTVHAAAQQVDQCAAPTAAQ